MIRLTKLNGKPVWVSRSKITMIEVIEGSDPSLWLGRSYSNLIFQPSLFECVRETPSEILSKNDDQ